MAGETSLGCHVDTLSASASGECAIGKCTTGESGTDECALGVCVTGVCVTGVCITGGCVTGERVPRECATGECAFSVMCLLFATRHQHKQLQMHSTQCAVLRQAPCMATSCFASRSICAHLNEEMDEPSGDTCSDHIHEEVADGKQPGEGVLQALVLQRVHDAGLVLCAR